MSSLDLKSLATAMSEIDIGHLATRTADGAIAIRPMSNNSEVEYEGDSYYFSHGDTRTVSDIAENKNVSVAFQGKHDGEDIWLTVVGEGQLHTDEATLKAHWDASIAKWFEDGLETEGLTLIEVKAERIHYWYGREEGELVLD